MKIYTRTGDKGTSALYNGERRPKNETVFEALGTNDELASAIGLSMEYCESLNTVTEQLHKVRFVRPQLFNLITCTNTFQIQCCIQDANSNIATPRPTSNEVKIQKTQFDPEGLLTKELETWIDQMDEFLPPLRNFILPVNALLTYVILWSKSN